jgi:hypothetical protein
VAIGSKAISISTMMARLLWLVNPCFPVTMPHFAPKKQLQGKSSPNPYYVWQVNMFSGHFCVARDPALLRRGEN